MKTLYTAEAISKGGRFGTIQTSDRPLYIPLGDPKEKIADQRPYLKALRGDTSVMLAADYPLS